MYLFLFILSSGLWHFSFLTAIFGKPIFVTCYGPHYENLVQFRAVQSFLLTLRFDLIFEHCSNLFGTILHTLSKTPWPISASELYRPSDRRLWAKLVPTFADRGCRVVSAADPYGSILDFLDRSRYCFFQVASQLYSRGWVNPVPDRLFLRKSGKAGNRKRTSASVARNSRRQRRSHTLSRVTNIA
jgi:hypothetical protein